VYVNGSSTQPLRDQTDPVVRNLEREMSQLSWLNPYTGVVENNIMVALADHTGMKTLHMITADPFRTPTFTPFADPNWFFFATGAPTPATCLTPAACAFIPARSNSSFAWNHGDIQDEIASTWVGYVGQGVDSIGIDSNTWSDHTDMRPTILELAGLKDDYIHDGRVITEILQGYAVPEALKKSASFVSLAQMYKQLNAPFGAFAMATLSSSSKALASNDANDSTYNSIEGQIQSLTTQRDALVALMIGLLNGAEFKGQSFRDAQAQSLIAQGQALLNQANGLPH